MSFDPVLDQKLDNFLLNEFGPEFFKPGLDRITECFSEYNTLFEKSNVKIITIAGTNGKGETSHYLNDLLCSDQKKTALWTSPHVLSVTERFKLLGEDISHEKLLSTFEIISKKSLGLSYYEFLFCCFCEMASKLELDYLVLEVGLGGRLDTTNLLDADLTLLCSISRDHEEYLGSDLEGILKEKLGITRSSAPHISALESGFLRDKQSAFLVDKKVSFVDLFENEVLNVSDDFSLRNQLLALSAYQRLNDREILRNELLETRKDFCHSVSKGRMEYVTFGEIKFIFIGAHNVDGVRKTISYLLNSKAEKSSGLICAFSKRPLEDIRNSLKMFEGAPCLWDSIYVSEFDHPKAFKISDLDKVSDNLEVVEWQSLIDKITTEQKGQWIVAGSYYFIGEVQKYLINRIPNLEF
jgi:dihydrofolate synthase/folylpolyglutamate synthase